MDASEEDPNNSISNFYKTDMLLIKKFLLEYSVGIADTFKYLLLLRSIKNRVLKVLEVELDDMLEFDPTEMPSVCGRIEANGKRYIELFSQALDSILADDEELPPDPNVISDSIDILQRQRKHQNELLRQRYEADNNPDNNDANAQMNQGGVAADGESKEAVEIDFPGEWSGLEWSGVEWIGVEWIGVDWSGVDWSGVEWIKLEWIKLEWSGVEWSGVEWSGVEWSRVCFFLITLHIKH